MRIDRRPEDFDRFLKLSGITQDTAQIDRRIDRRGGELVLKPIEFLGGLEHVQLPGDQAKLLVNFRVARIDFPGDLEKVERA